MNNYKSSSSKTEFPLIANKTLMHAPIPSTKFSHIYIEEDLRHHEQVKEILLHFKDARIIYIAHYKDIFCRSRQNYILQKHHTNLILAKKEGKLIYPGVPVCQNFGQEYFYYTSCIMNCIYDCEYCYLQGMYASANLVVFLNLFDVFFELEGLLQEHPVYLCVSYDTDLLALENLFGFVQAWIEFAKKHQNLTIEIRTKSANFHSICTLSPIPNVIFAWTLSPNDVIEAYEHGTPSLAARLTSIQEAIAHGFPVRLCFDPMIWMPDFKQVYRSLIDDVFQKISSSSLHDVSVGVFRVSNVYLKRMRNQRISSGILNYPYALSNGVYSYKESQISEMMQYMCSLLKEYLPEEKIFRWDIYRED